MPDISQVLSRQLTGALTSASDRIQDRWVLLWASLLIKQGTMWSGNRTHERRVWTACYNHLSYSIFAVGAFLSKEWIHHPGGARTHDTEIGVSRSTIWTTGDVFDKTLSFIIIKGVSPFVGLPRKQVLLRWANVKIDNAVSVFYKAHSLFRRGYYARPEQRLWLKVICMGLLYALFVI